MYTQEVVWLLDSNPVGRGGAGGQQPNRVRLVDSNPVGRGVAGG